MKTKTLDLLIEALKAEIKANSFTDKQRTSIIQEVADAFWSTEQTYLFTDEQIENAILLYLNKVGNDSARGISKGIGLCEKKIFPYLQGLVDNNTIIHNGETRKGSQYFKNDKNSSIVLDNLLEQAGIEASLTERESEVLSLIFQGIKYTEIAKILGLARSTVYKYRTRLINKFDAKDDIDLILKVVGVK